ncbi:hypothetical protein V5O48_017081 [Marasmius crinis-equi]|uniref:Uncharacterized protein n=1 Tax=Marasmius crinis-equi TaxID=585013 RepID=A0ABR3EPZ4_9AGAR
MLPSIRSTRLLLPPSIAKGVQAPIPSPTSALNVGKGKQAPALPELNSFVRYRIENGARLFRSKGKKLLATTSKDEISIGISEQTGYTDGVSDDLKDDLAQ